MENKLASCLQVFCSFRSHGIGVEQMVLLLSPTGLGHCNSCLSFTQARFHFFCKLEAKIHFKANVCARSKGLKLTIEARITFFKKSCG